MRGLGVMGFVALLGAAPASGAAQTESDLVPDPATLGPYRALEFYTSLVFPLERTQLCPPTSECIFGGGGAVGARVEWRWPRGLALGLGYDLWLLDGNGVYEITTVQTLQGGVRYYGLRDQLVHPYVAVDVGVLLLGDAFRRNTVGASLEGAVGIELEITSTLAFTSRLAFRGFSTGPFRSRSDGVARADEFGVDIATTLTVGLVLSQVPGSD